MAKTNPKILWVDDEIDLLKSHVQFLEEKGYELTTAVAGQDAVALVSEQSFSAVLLDEIMPGMDGLSTLQAIKEVDQAIPVIMVTKSTEESLMDEAYWGDIADFIVKPVNPHQILSSLKKILELENLRRDRFVAGFGAYYNQAQQALFAGEMTFAEWADFYAEMCAANREIDALSVNDLRELQSDLYREADRVFSSWLVSRFPDWLSESDRDAPILSHNLLEKLVFPLMSDKRPVYLIVIDCLRFDQWLAVEEKLGSLFRIERNSYCSLLPTTTCYARNAIFAGLTPKEMAEKYAGKFQEGDNTSDSLNKYEEEFLNDNLASRLPGGKQARYYKFTSRESEQMADKVIKSLPRRPLNVFIFNFVDTITHESGRHGALDVLAPTVDGLRRLAVSWFLASPVERLLAALANDKEAVVVITTDHGSQITSAPTIVYADKEASKTPRLWIGRDMRVEGDGAFLVKRPEEFGLPEDYLAKTYLLALADHHLVFSHYIHKYHKKFSGGFFHGGVSMAENILPAAVLYPK